MVSTHLFVWSWCYVRRVPTLRPPPHRAMEAVEDTAGNMRRRPRPQRSTVTAVDNMGSNNLLHINTVLTVNLRNCLRHHQQPQLLQTCKI